MAELRDKPRPTVYWPNTPTQWRESSVDDCTWYATEFAFEAASVNHLNMHPVKDLRNKSSDTSGGTPLLTALSETYRLWPKSEMAQYRYGAESRTAIRRALKDGSTIVYGGDYANLPVHYRRWTNSDTFAHAMASRDYREVDGVGYTFLYDPLGGGPTREPYNGEWIPLSALLKFNWDNGADRYYVGTVYGYGGKDRMIKGVIERTSSKYVELPAGVKVYDSPDGKVIRTVKVPKRYDYFGYVGPWWAIEIWYKEGPVIAYIEKNETFERGAWPTDPPVEPPVIPDVTALEARIEELESALLAISGISDEALDVTLEDVDGF